MSGWLRRRREPERRGAHRRGQEPRPEPAERPTPPPEPDPRAQPMAAPIAERATAYEAQLTIDALGRKCPIPIIMLAAQLRDVPVGAIIAVLADDPAAQPDIPSWCRMKSQEFVREVPQERGWAFLIRRCY